MWNRRREPVTALGCFVAMKLGLWYIFPQFGPLMIPPHREMVFLWERYSFCGCYSSSCSKRSLGRWGVAFSFWSGERGMG